jgi:hypothetical protein
MKKILLLLFLVIVCQKSMAQIEVGIRPGMNLAYRKVYNEILFAGGPFYRQKMYVVTNKAIRPAFFIYAAIPLSQSLKFSPEIGFMGQGAAEKFAKHTASFDYINLLLNINYAANDRFSIQMGPYVGYTYTKYQRPFEVGFDIGAQYLIVKDLSVGLGYFYGISNTGYNINDFGDVYKFEAYNRALQIYVKFKPKSIRE